MLIFHRLNNDVTALEVYSGGNEGSLIVPLLQSTKGSSSHFELLSPTDEEDDTIDAFDLMLRNIREVLSTFSKDQLMDMHAIYTESDKITREDMTGDVSEVVISDIDQKPISFLLEKVVPAISCEVAQPKESDTASTMHPQDGGSPAHLGLICQLCNSGEVMDECAKCRKRCCSGCIDDHVCDEAHGKLWLYLRLFLNALLFSHRRPREYPTSEDQTRIWGKSCCPGKPSGGGSPHWSPPKTIRAIYMEMVDKPNMATISLRDLRCKP